MKPKKILYIGNNLSSKEKNITTIKILSDYLTSEGCTVFIASSKEHKVFRLIDMMIQTINKRKVDYLLIDTYSTINFYYAFIVSQIARIFNIKYIPILHGGNLPNRIKTSKYLSNLIFKNSYCNIAPSNYLKEEFEKNGYQTNHIPNIIDIKKYIFLKRNIIIPKLLWVRSINEIYNPLMAVKVLKEVKKTYPDAILCMIGPNKNDYFNDVLNSVKQLNLETSIEFTGSMKKEAWHKKSNDFNIFINTSNLDNMPVTIIEAMALGLPVISTNVGGIPYLISDNVNGKLVSENAVSDMSKKIISLVNNSEEVNSMVLKARKEVEKYDWSLVRNSWIKLLK